MLKDMYIYIYVLRDPADERIRRRGDERRRGSSQGFQGYGFRLSTIHFEFLRSISGLRRCVFCFFELGPLNSIV